jgi:hypothetical protein
VAEALLVPFAGDGSGVGELSWGQQTVWRGIAARGAPIWLLGLEKQPAGKTVGEIAGLLSFVMSRHQSLRTRVLVDDGHARQEVASSGEIELQVADADDDADPLAFALALQAEMAKADLDFASQWPVQMAVVRHRGVPAYRVTAMNHIVTDGFGMLALQADIALRDPVTGGPGKLITATEPLEQAAWQGSGAGRKRSAVAERHWERVLRVIPPRMFPVPGQWTSPRYAEAVFTSRAAFLASQLIAARAGVDTSPVLLAAFAVAMTRTTGVNPAAPRVMVNNRFRPGLAETVSPVAQSCPCLIDVAGITFDDAVKRAYYASLNAYKHAYFEPARIREVIASVTAERGEQIDLFCVYNDRRMATPRDVDAEVPQPRQVRAALPLTTLRWEADTTTSFCHIQIFDAPDTLEVRLAADSQYVSSEHVEACLRQAESVLVEAACDPAARTGV